MNCIRCSGFVVAELLSDPQGTTERLEAVRCLNCGNIQDAIIEANRSHCGRQPASRVPRPPVARGYLDVSLDSAWKVS